MQGNDVRGIRPQIRLGLIVTDLLLFLIAAPLAAALGDITSPTREQLLLLAALLWAASVVAQPRGETGRSFDFHDVIRLSLGATLGTLIVLTLEKLPDPLWHASGRLVLIAAVVGFILRMALRVGIVAGRKLILSRRPNARRVVVVGSGKAATSLIHIIAETPGLPYRIVGCVDDDTRVRRVDGARILGRVGDLPQLIEKHGVDCVIVATPSAPLPFINQVIAICSKARSKPCAVKVLPSASDLLNDRVKVSHVRDLRIEDVLAREPVRMDISAVSPYIENQVVLVTGAGGSIGSELCRQICRLNPRLLLLLGHGENSLFAIEQELRQQHAFTRTKMILADVADSPAIRSVFSTYRPKLVFHAAAHKHVPILEFNVCEAVRNNVIGTHVVSLAAAASGTAKFVLLSTDKAVNPTSVMGVTKRMAELICQSFANNSGTEFVSVRFGNVLGSRGSVIPIFRQQLENGGPLTVTHRDMTRYFMTIPEAVSLVLEAMALGRDGQVFVLDMGNPVKIVHLAETVIRLAGLEPYRDIDIVETSIRPGEKLFEEVLTTSEGVTRTSHERLFIAQQDRLDYGEIARGLTELSHAIRATDSARALAVLHEFVPAFRPGEHLVGTPAQPVAAETERGEIAAPRTRLSAPSPAVQRFAVAGATE
ncbi:MAG: polysaccharide biosynthesis protein [Candidatus Eremiobacteraeota bacterium]|nr:polysaccharide biosynthesis protein [Candidatus Eremiobacteraeota bacterium]